MSYSRYIGLDLHKKFVQATALDADGRVLKQWRFDTTPEAIRNFADSPAKTDAVAMESTTNAVPVALLLREHAGEVVVSNPMKTRAIAEAKVKTDKVDSEVLARLLRADFLPTVWIPDAKTQRRRELSSYRTGLVRERTQVKNRIHAILHRNLIPRPDVRDLFGKTGRAYLEAQELPPGEAFLMQDALRHLDFLEERIAKSDAEIAGQVADDPGVRLAMSLPGVSLQVAYGMLSAIGEIGRFAEPKKLVSYLGLDPLSKSSADEVFGPRRISGQGRSHARWLMVEAATAAVRVAGPLQSFHQRLRARKCHNKAIVATARKMVVILWHMLMTGEPYRYAPPLRTEEKLRRVERMAGSPKRQGGVARGVDPRTLTQSKRKAKRHDWELARQAQAQYEELVRLRAAGRSPAPGG